MDVVEHQAVTALLQAVEWWKCGHGTAPVSEPWHLKFASCRPTFSIMSCMTRFLAAWRKHLMAFALNVFSPPTPAQG
jgi:hypothetical protein